MEKSVDKNTGDVQQGASIYNVAERAGVSIVTVSRVFNDYPHVSERMRERVFSAARSVGYTPRLVSKRNVIAAIIGHLDHLSAGDYKTRLLLQIVRSAAEQSYLVEFIPFDSVQLATKHLVDGIVEVGLTEEEVLQLAGLPSVPSVAINKDKVLDGWSTVSSDHMHETQLATNHLLDNGHTQIALVLDELTGTGVERRRAGFEETIHARLGSAGKSEVFAAATQSPTTIAKNILDNGFTACINLSDNYGLALVDGFINELKVSIPNDVSMICLENEAVSAFSTPRMTTIDQPLSAVANCAVDGIVENIGATDARRWDRVFKSRLIERDSVRRLA